MGGVDAEQMACIERAHHSHAGRADADVDEVDDAGVLEPNRDLRGVVRGQPATVARLLVADEADADRDAFAHCRAHCLQHLHAETHAVDEAAAIQENSRTR